MVSSQGKSDVVAKVECIANVRGCLVVDVFQSGRMNIFLFVGLSESIVVSNHAAP